jgi:hypothetical protein
VDVPRLALGVLAFIGVVVFIVNKLAGKTPADLGSVSDAWIAQHRRER